MMSNERASKRRRLSPPAEGAASSLPGFATWNIEQDYERRPRKNKKKEESSRLPVKSQESGRWERDPAKQDASDQDEDSNLNSDAEEEGEDSAVADLRPQPLPKKNHVSSKEEIRQAKEELARIAGLLSESPEENISLLTSLAQFAHSSNPTVKKLALGTQYAVYKDIIPGYRIRPLATDDPSAKLSKDVRKLRTFEQSLLSGYKDYVQLLSRLAANKTGDNDADLAILAVSCTSNLLTTLPHFNFRNDLLAILVRCLSKRTLDASSNKSLAALEQLFREDEDGHASLEAVTQLTRMLKARNYHVHESVLNTFLHLRLLSEFAHKASTNRVDKEDGQQQQPRGKPIKAARGKKVFRTKRDRKLLRERKDVEKEMREADAVVSYEERDKNQAETLKLVFVAYFRILKARTPHLMGAVLEGLARYAHLINQDFFGDVLEGLREIINDSGSLLQGADGDDDGDGDGDGEVDDDTDDKHHRNATRESLLSIITAFALLQGQQDVAKSASTLHLDLDFFTTHLYRTLLPLSMDVEIEDNAKASHLGDVDTISTPTAQDAKVNISTTTVLLLRSLHAVLLPPNTPTKSIPPLRVAAFIKQILPLSLHLPPKSARALLALLQQVVKTHGGRISALWHSEERRGDGVWDAEGGSVEGSNAFAGTVWEGELLRNHWDPRVRDGWGGVVRGVREVG